MESMELMAFLQPYIQCTTLDNAYGKYRFLMLLLAFVNASFFKLP